MDYSRANEFGQGGEEVKEVVKEEVTKVQSEGIGEKTD